jgi:hypothetical protein
MGEAVFSRHRNDMSRALSRPSTMAILASSGDVVGLPSGCAAASRRPDLDTTSETTLRLRFVGAVTGLYEGVAEHPRIASSLVDC